MEIGISFVLDTLCRLFFNELYVVGIAECCASDMLFQPHKLSFCCISTLRTMADLACDLCRVAMTKSCQCDRFWQGTYAMMAILDTSIS